MTRTWLLATGLLGVLIAGCGSTTEPGDDVLGIDSIDRAVEAVRTELGNDPEFFEINSTAEGVNLFIATSRGSAGVLDGVVQARYTPTGGLIIADDVLEASGPTFSGTGLALSSSRLTSSVERELQDSRLLMFVVTAGSGPEVLFRIVVESDRGGRLSVFVAEDGTILGTDVMESTATGE